MGCFRLTKAFFSLVISIGSRSIVDPTCSASFWSVAQVGPRGDSKSVLCLSAASCPGSFPSDESRNTSVTRGFVLCLSASMQSPSPTVPSSSIRGLPGFLGRWSNWENLSFISSITGIVAFEFEVLLLVETSCSLHSSIRGLPFVSSMSPTSSIRGLL